MCPFPSLCPSLKVFLVGLLCENESILKKTCSEQCVECGSKRPRISGEVDGIRVVFRTQSNIYDEAFFAK